MADVASKGPAAQQGALRKGRWLPVAIGAVAAGVVAGFAYYGMQVFRDSAYEDERAFRVLGLIVDQFGNLQEAIAGALRVIPTDTFELKGTELVTHDSTIRKYQGTLALRNVELNIEKDAKGCVLPPVPAEFHVDIRTAQRRFSMCQRRKTDSVSFTLSGPLADQLPAFIAQDLFDSVIITTHDGTRLAHVVRARDRESQVQLHDVTDVDPLGGRAADLLQRAARHAPDAAGMNAAATGATGQSSAGVSPGYATVFNEEIAGRPFRVFVLPFLPAHATIVHDSNAATNDDGKAPPTASEPHLYIIALKEQRVLGAVNEALGSGGALIITLSVLLGILAWPMVSLRFASPQESIAASQLFAILFSLLLLPAVVATAGFSLWTRYRLELWADQHAEHYARRVDRALTWELHSGVAVIESLAAQFKHQYTEELADLTREDSLVVDKTSNDVCVSGSSECEPPRKTPLAWFSPPFPGWSPVRLAVPVNRYGQSWGLTISYFSEAPNRLTDVSDREYFKAIMQHEEWQPGALWAPFPVETTREHRYVAQRLFNRTDAARALQLAVPIDDAEGRRLGVVTGDSRAYALTRTLRVPLLRFAVVDSTNGSVLFHSLDRLSLAENLFVETEHNAALEAAMQRRASVRSQLRTSSEDHFSGRYLGVGHRFFYRPVAGAPWGIVVFYPTDAIDEIVLQTAVATLACYFALVSVATLVLGLLVLALPERADLAALKWVWPKWQSRDRYPRVAFVLMLILLAVAVALLGRLTRFNWAQIVVAIASLIALLVAMFRTPFRQDAQPAPASLTAYKQSYVRCIFGFLVFVSALPALVIGIGYHDTSLRAAIRDELEDAAGDEQQRRHALLHDLRRVTHEGEQPWKQQPPEEWIAALSRTLPVPGYTFGKIDGDRMRQGTWLLTDTAPGPWLHECGPPVLGTIRRMIWSLSTAKQAQRAFGQRPAQDVQSAERADQDAPAPGQKCRTGIAARAWLPDDDATRITTTTMPLALGRLPEEITDTSTPNLPDCSRVRSTPCRDPELYFKYAAGSGLALVSTALVCIVLITLLSAFAARRLFGIRIPFAARFTLSDSDPQNASQLLDAELDLLALKKANPAMTSKDEADWRAVRCSKIYDRMWTPLPADEKLLLHQLAGRRFANPENQPVIERLLRRGYLTLAPWPRIVEPGFAAFIRTVELDEPLGKLKYETTHTLWSQMRTPLLLVVVVVATLLMWLAGSAMHILAGTLAGVATLFGSITQVTSFIHREKPPGSR